jgi:hypothetical protein
LSPFCIFCGHFVYFVAILYILWPFCTFCGHFVYFVSILCFLWSFTLRIFSRFGTLHREKVWQPCAWTDALCTFCISWTSSVISQKLNYLHT